MCPSNRQRITHRWFVAHCATLPGSARSGASARVGGNVPLPSPRKPAAGPDSALSHVADGRWCPGPWPHPTLVVLCGRESVQGPRAEWS